MVVNSIKVFAKIDERYTDHGSGGIEPGFRFVNKLDKCVYRGCVLY